MKVTTMQVDGADALRAVADGKKVQMVWTNAGEPVFLNFNQKIADLVRSGDAFLIVEIENDELTVAAGTPLEEIAISQQDLADTCENAADESEPFERLDEIDDPEQEIEPTGDDHPESATEIITDQELEKNGPVVVEIPNSKRRENARWRKLDDDLIAKLRDDGLTERQIAEQLDTSQVTIHNHIVKMKKEARL